MITQNRDGRELAASLARPILCQIAPEEEEDFDEVVEDFFDDFHEHDRLLGGNFEFVPDLIIILFFISQTLSNLLTAKATRRERKNWLEICNSYMNWRSGRVETPPAKPLPEFSPKNLHNAIGQTAQESDFGDQAGLLAKLTMAGLGPLTDEFRVDLEMFVQVEALGGQSALRFSLYSPNSRLSSHFKTITGSPFRKDPESLMPDLPSRLAACQDESGEELAALGRDLYRWVFPKPLQDTYREIRQRVRTLRITSDEPWIPWELIKPYDDSKPEDVIDDDFLAVRYHLTRWLAGDMQPTPVIELRQMMVGNARESECERIRTLFKNVPGVVDLSPRDPGRQEILDLLRGERLDLMHFTGSGTCSEPPEEPGIRLGAQGSEVLRPHHLSGPCPHSGALVFLNSDWGARLERGWLGLRGWVECWTAHYRCGALIAPLWDVEPELACDFAETFYTTLIEGKTFGEAALAARLRLREKAPGNPASLAYAVYALPSGKLVLAPGGRN